MTDSCPSCREPVNYPSGDGCAAMTLHKPVNKYQKHLEAMAEYRAFVADNPGSRPTRQQLAAWLQPGLEFLFGGKCKERGGPVTEDYKLDPDLPAQLESVALTAEIATHYIDDMRVMPAAGVADILYEALDEIKRHRGIEE